MKNKYKTILIADILEFQTFNRYTREELEKKTIEELEKIFDDV